MRREDGQMVLDDDPRLSFATAPPGALKSVVAAKDTLEKMEVPEKSGISLIQKEGGHIVRVLDTVVKTAGIRRTDEYLEIKRLITPLTANAYEVSLVEPKTFKILHQIPSDFNDPQAKTEYLRKIEPLVVAALKFDFQQIAAYAHLVEIAVGAAA